MIALLLSDDLHVREAKKGPEKQIIKSKWPKLNPSSPFHVQIQNEGQSLRSECDLAAALLTTREGRVKKTVSCFKTVSVYWARSTARVA